MSLQNCILSAKQWLKENSDVKISASELEQVGKLLHAAEELGATPAEKNALMGEFIEQKLAVLQARERAKNLLNAITVEKSKTTISANVENWAKQGMSRGDAAVEAFKSFIRGGSTRPGEGTNLDPSYLTSTTFRNYLSIFKTALGNEDVKILQSLEIGDQMSRDIYQELHAIENKLQLGQSNNDGALRIAKAIRATQDAVLNDVKGVNPYVEAAKDFLIHRNHSRDAIAAVPREDWVKEAMQHFSGSFLGDTLEEKQGKFRDMYDDIVSGKFGSDDFDAQSFWKPGGTGGNQAARNAGSRVLVAPDWMNEWQYASKYGDSIWNNMMRQIDSQSRTVGRLQKWGPNIADNFSRVYNAVSRSLNDPNEKAAFRQNEDQFKKLFEATMGHQDNVARGMAARLAEGAMAAQNMAGLGLHVPRSLNGIQAGITLAKDAFGNTYFGNAFNLTTSISKAMLSMDGGREAAQALGAVLRDVARDAVGAIRPTEAQPGMAGKLGQLIGRLSLTDRWVAAQKFGMVNLFTKELGTRAGLSFEALPPETQRTLSRYSLGGDAWEVMRQGAQDGRITPESIAALTKEQLGPLLKSENPRELARVRGELDRNFGTMLNDHAGLMVGESNSRSRYAAYGNTSVNDGWGMAARMMMQFKQSALIRQQLVARTYRNGGGALSGTGGVFQLAIGSAFLSMVGEGLIALSAGKSLPSPTDEHMIGHAMRGTGLLGIFGDVLASALEQPKANPTDQVKSAALTLAGPAPRTVLTGGAATLKTLHGISEAAQGKESPGQFGGKYWAQLIHGLTPGQNLFYTKAALDYMFMNELHEFMGGNGYLEALRRGTQAHEGWPEGLGGEGGRQHYTFGGKNFWE